MRKYDDGVLTPDAIDKLLWRLDAGVLSLRRRDGDVSLPTYNGERAHDVKIAAALLTRARSRTNFIWTFTTFLTYRELASRVVPRMEARQDLVPRRVIEEGRKTPIRRAGDALRSDEQEALYWQGPYAALMTGMKHLVAPVVEDLQLALDKKGLAVVLEDELRQSRSERREAAAMLLSLKYPWLEHEEIGKVPLSNMVEYQSLREQQKREVNWLCHEMSTWEATLFTPSNGVAAQVEDLVLMLDEGIFASGRTTCPVEVFRLPENQEEFAKGTDVSAAVLHEANGHRLHRPRNPPGGAFSADETGRFFSWLTQAFSSGDVGDRFCTARSRFMTHELPWCYRDAINRMDTLTGRGRVAKEPDAIRAIDIFLPIVNRVLGQSHGHKVGFSGPEPLERYLRPPTGTVR